MNSLHDREWYILLRRIKDGRCTPFLGAGAAFPSLPLGKDLARAWAEEYSYPLKDPEDLARVAQFLAVDRDRIFPKEEFAALTKNATTPDFSEPDEPHAVLARLPLAVYLTTNYDGFMMEALHWRLRNPQRELCRWNPLTRDFPSIFDTKPNFEPTPTRPLVFHLHGHDGIPESILLTEDDYLDFLAAISSREDLLPSPVRRALAADSLLFIGYSISDWNLRVILRGLRLRGRMCVAVLFPPEGMQSSKAQEYLTLYYGHMDNMDLKIYWGTAREFARELRQRWEDYDRGTNTN